MILNNSNYLIGEGMIGGYGGTDILNNCSISVNKGEIAVIVGPNGAGKSTAMKAILGMIKLRKGIIKLQGTNITKISPQDKVRLGIAFVPQTKNVFTGMTVQENLEMGAHLRDDDILSTLDQIYTLFPALKNKRNQLAGELSGGQRQQVAVGRAMMTKPKVLLLDEPTAGVSPIVMDELFERIIEIKQSGVAIMIVEQNARQALSIADKGFVLVNGENKKQGAGKDLLADPEVRRSFLGG